MKSVNMILQQFLNLNLWEMEAYWLHSGPWVKKWEMDIWLGHCVVFLGKKCKLLTSKIW